MKHKKTNTFKELQNFFILWFGQSISQFGSAMTSYALIISAYKQQGTVLSISWLSICTYLPYVLVSIFAGPWVDRLKKKTTMLACDTIAATCSLCTLILLTIGLLELGHLYVINTIIGFMNAFQSPASNVAVSLIVPQKHYSRANGMQSLSGSFVAVFAPILATTLLSFYSVQAVIIVDLISFAICFLTLLLFVKIEESSKSVTGNTTAFVSECKEGFQFLYQNKGIMHLMLFMAIINLLAAMAYNSVLPAMMLVRSGGGDMALGIVTACIGAGGIIGGILASITKPPKSKVKTIFNCCAISMLFGNVLLGIGQNVLVWGAAVLIGNIPLPFLNASESSLIRVKIPIELQGRLFSIRAALQFGTIPIGYLLGGILADKIFEPLMQGSQIAMRIFSPLVGTGRGSGMAVIFLLAGVLGIAVSLIYRNNSHIKKLDE